MKKTFTFQDGVKVDANTVGEAIFVYEQTFHSPHPEILEESEMTVEKIELPNYIQ